MRAPRGRLLFLARRKRVRARLELKFLPYAEADRLMRETRGAWTLAPEEDSNRVFGMVYLERLEGPMTHIPNWRLALDVAAVSVGLLSLAALGMLMVLFERPWP